MLTARAYTILVYLFVGLAASSFGLAIYYSGLDTSNSQIHSSGGNTPKADLKTEMSDLNSLLGVADGQISQLNSLNRTV